MKKYETPVIEITVIQSADIITASGGLLETKFHMINRSDLKSANDNSVSF